MRARKADDYRRLADKMERARLLVNEVLGDVAELRLLHKQPPPEGMGSDEWNLVRKTFVIFVEMGHGFRQGTDTAAKNTLLFARYRHWLDQPEDSRGVCPRKKHHQAMGRAGKLKCPLCGPLFVVPNTI